MTEQPQPSFTNTMEKAGKIIAEHLMPAAVQGTDPLGEAIGELSDDAVQAALVFAVFFDSYQQRGEKLAYSIDLPALDALTTAAESGVTEVRDVVLELPVETAAEALGELIYLHREINVTQAIASTSASLN